MSINIHVQHEDFDLASEYTSLRSRTSKIGAVVTFTGLVRDFERLHDDPTSGQNLHTLTLEHYPGMTERLIAEIVDEALQRWSAFGVTVIHRVGCLRPNEQIVFVGVTSEHRENAFKIAEFVMDYLKTKATFWKKVDLNGQQQWIMAKHSDTKAAAKWTEDSDE
ncbi:MAG: molybdenum cofactor biosynthesis protein MoaE [Porticoccaceae bacterium]|nr:molybdenum cofactor biosynthesis protein MoaE [Porticoccaceae bacterium]MDG1474068.1 molybdenum cofactor biosynthesis protein MoaE [Porticoccaceae bacterium]